MAKLIRIDRNGTKYYEDNTCPKCNGNGYIRGYEHVEGGVCFLCGGTGNYTTHWKEMTPEYAQKLADRRLAKARAKSAERNAQFLKKLGFSEDGKAWIVLGNTFEIKDNLKAAGAKFHNLLGWHFDHEDNGFDCFEITTNDVMYEAIDYTLDWKADWMIIEFIKEQKALHAPKTDSEFIGEIGDKVEMKLTFKSEHTFETHYSYYGELNFIYKFADEAGNTIVWKTSKCIDLEEGVEYIVKGAIKAHNEYKGDKQTILTRCKIKAA